MARHLLRLKLALVRAGLARAGAYGTVAFVFAYLLAVGGGCLFALVLVLFRGVDPGALTQWVGLAFAAMLIGWVVLPLTAAGAEGTLDADALALLPLRAPDLMPGLLLASALGFGGVMTAIMLVGAAVGLAPPSPAAVVTVAACVLQLAVCVATGRLVITVLSMAARKRRWRDVALTVAPLLGVALQGVRFLRIEETTELPYGLRVATLLLPSGPPSIAAAAARQGRMLFAVVALVVGLAYLAVLLQLWWSAIQRVTTTAEERGPATSGPPRSLFRGLARWLPRDRVGAVAAKELRVSWREPRQRALRLSLAFPAVAPFFVLHGSDGLVVATVLPAYFLTAGATNQFGFDGARHWANVAAGDDIRRDLLGKNLALAVQVAVVVTVLAAAAVAVTGAWGRLLPALGLAVTVLGLSLGLGNVMSVSVPIPMPDSDTNLWSRGNAGQGMAAVGPAMVVLTVNVAVLVPLAVAAVTVDHPTTVAATVAGMVALGVGAWALGLRAAVRRSKDRQPELLERLSGG